MTIVRHVAIVGGGFSGAALALHLLRQGCGATSVALTRKDCIVTAAAPPPASGI